MNNGGLLTSVTFLLATGSGRNAPEFPHRLFKSNADDAPAARLLSHGYHAAALFSVTRGILAVPA